MKQPLPTEHQEALALVQWLKMMDLPFTKIPNETYTKSWSQRRKNTVEGVSAGIPDYLIVIPKRYIVFIELKRLKSSPSQTSEAQLAWQKTLNTVPNVEAFVCKGAEEATRILTKIINGTYIR